MIDPEENKTQDTAKANDKPDTKTEDKDVSTNFDEHMQVDEEGNEVGPEDN